jgi:hypothetical protein
MKEQKQLDNTKEKKNYEKPRLSTVTLFADQVMGNCNLPSPTSGCNVISRS